MNKGSNHCRVNSTGESTNDFTFAYLFLDSSYTIIDEIAHRPVTLAATDAINEIFQYRLPFRGMDYLRMKLKTEDTLPITHDGGRWIFGVG